VSQYCIKVFLDFVAHFAGARSTENGNLTVPSRAEIFTKTVQAQQATQRMKMFSDAQGSRVELSHYALRNGNLRQTLVVVVVQY